MIKPIVNAILKKILRPIVIDETEGDDLGLIGGDGDKLFGGDLIALKGGDQ